MASHVHILVVVDEFGNRIPGAYCFSNWKTTEVYSIFVASIKDRVGVLTPAVFMSDDKPSFYNAWESIMGPVPHRLLCSWHVLHNWKDKLSLIRDPEKEKKKLVYKTLKALLKTCVESVFLKGLEKVQKSLKEDEDTLKFYEYFEKNYVPRITVWAYCYRVRLGMNTSMLMKV